MKRFVPFIIVGAVALLTASGAGLLYRAKRQVPQVIAPGREQPNGVSGHSLGPVDARVTLEEYGDYQCPPCGAMAEPLRQMVRDFPALRLIFRNYPLAMHQRADVAARAAEAAGLQNRFWEMHDLLFKEQGEWTKAPDVQKLFSAYAAMLRLDVDRFEKDMVSGTVTNRIRADQSRAAKVGATNTPSFFLNDRAIPASALGEKNLRAAVEVAVKGKPPN